MSAVRTIDGCFKFVCLCYGAYRLLMYICWEKSKGPVIGKTGVCLKLCGNLMERILSCSEGMDTAMQGS